MATCPWSRLSYAIIKLICKKCGRVANPGVSQWEHHGYSPCQEECESLGAWRSWWEESLGEETTREPPGECPGFSSCVSSSGTPEQYQSHSPWICKNAWFWIFCLVLKNTTLLISMVLCTNFCLKKKKNHKLKIFEFSRVLFLVVENFLGDG